MSTIRISVIIPTKNRHKDLANCIEALEGQDYKQDLFELIIIDDDSSETTLTLNKQIISKSGLNITFLEVRDNKKGVVAARNLGLRYAKGEIVGFLDDDSIPNKNWLTNLSNYFDSFPKVIALTGRVNAVELSHPLSMFRQNFYEMRYSRLVNPNSTPDICARFNLDVPISLHLADYLAGGNSAVRREAIEQIGHFDENFIMMHDKEMALRLLNNQHWCVFAPDVVVKHVHTKSVSDAFRKSFRSGRMQFYLQKKYQGIVQAYSLDFLRPFRLLRDSRHLKDQMRWKFIILCVLIFVLEYSHQLGYMSVAINLKFASESRASSPDSAEYKTFQDDDFEITIMKRLPDDLRNI